MFSLCKQLGRGSCHLASFLSTMLSMLTAEIMGPCVLYTYLFVCLLRVLCYSRSKPLHGCTMNEHPNALDRFAGRASAPQLAANSASMLLSLTDTYSSGRGATSLAVSQTLLAAILAQTSTVAVRWIRHHRPVRVRELRISTPKATSASDRLQLKGLPLPGSWIGSPT